MAEISLADRLGAAPEEADGPLEAVFAELASGSHDALDALYRLCAPRIYGLALWRTGCREDAEGVLQDVFVKLMGMGSRLETVRKPRAFLLTLAHNQAVDRLRRRRTSAEPSDTLLEPVLEAPERRVDASRLSDLLRHLPPAQREVVYLRHFAELGFAEIGDITGVPTFTAASRYRLALRRLRRRLGVRT